MIYSKVYLDSFGYELPPHVVTSDELEMRLEPVYEALHFRPGQLEAITGIRERRFWDSDYKMRVGAIKAGQKALDAADITPADIGILIYGGVCRDNLEPATACAVANGLGLGADIQIYDDAGNSIGKRIEFDVDY